MYAWWRVTTLCLQWLNQNYPETICRSYYVYDRYFEEEFKVPGTKRGLRKDAVPSQFLISGMNSQLNYEDNII
jgi:hypothetical protein